jgi:predicted amidophosphoribosyltransferase
MICPKTGLNCYDYECIWNGSCTKRGITIPIGWKCPNCGAGVSPQEKTCPNCKPPLEPTCETP